MYTGVSIQPHWSNQRDLLVQTSQNLFSFFFVPTTSTELPRQGGTRPAPSHPVAPFADRCSQGLDPAKAIVHLKDPRRGFQVLPRSRSASVRACTALDTREPADRGRRTERVPDNPRERERERDYSPLLHRRLSTASQAVLFLSSVHATQDQDW